MRALVTGSAGFIGRHVCRALDQHGFEVTGYDLEPAGESGIRDELGDLLDLDRLTAVAHGHTVICHIGAIGDVYRAGADPALAANVNVTGSAHVAEAAARTDSRVVYASTWEVYGRPRYEPIDEDHPCDPDHPYNITKFAGERILLAADRLRDIPTLALRLGTAYGPGMRSNSVFRIFIDRARRGEPITIQGDGSQARQFTHADDVASAFVLAAHSDKRGMALNTVAPESVSIKQLADMVTERFPTAVSFTEPRQGDIASAQVSSERIAAQLGWTAETTFDQGITALLDDAARGR